MYLEDLLSHIDYRLICGKPNKHISSLEYNSKKVKEDSMFFALRGHREDGRAYISEAIKRGAVAVVLSGYDEVDRGEAYLREVNHQNYKHVTFIEVDDARKALAQISCVAFDNPADKMMTIGVTGTKGKTSVSFMIKEILESAGIKTGIIGTVKSGFHGHYEDSQNTTPESLEIQRMLRKMTDGGCKAVVMEVSSQGLMDKRVDGMTFDIGVFTNIWPDHIGKGEHESFEEYLYYKSQLFKTCSRAVLNGEDSNCRRVIKEGSIKNPVLFGKQEAFDYYIKSIVQRDVGEVLTSDFSIAEKKDCKETVHRLSLNMPGAFNVQNAAAAIAVARTMSIPWDIIEKGIDFVKIPGRTEMIPCPGDYKVMVDYAHNGEALRTLLGALKEHNPKRLILVFGSGGNRDKNRRFQMGRAAYDLADYIIVTSDNPRNEDPKEIIKDITSVMDFCHKPILVILDRKEAIERAMAEARAGDLIVIAGKGHEKYQIIGDKTVFFDDREVVLSYGKEQ